MQVAIQDRALDRLRDRFGGEVVRPHDHDYDQARRVHNGLIDRRPALVVRPCDVDDVVVAVEFARSADLPIAIRGGGHSVAGHGTCDGGLVVDLSAMRAVRVDPDARRAHVQGGALLGDVDRATQEFGLATPTGQVSATGIAGLTLSGGLGAMQRKYGLTCDNLVSAQVVTGTGEVVTASDSKHRELFWALRGGGGNFGVVTSFEFRLHPVGPMVAGGLVAYPVEQAVDVLRFLDGFIATAPEELSADAIFQFAPPLEVIPEHLRGERLIGLFIRYIGDPDDGLQAVRPIQAFGEPVLDFVGPLPYLAVQSMLDPLNPKGYLNYWTGEYVPELDAAAAEALARHGAELPAPQSIVQVIPFNAAPTRVAKDATAFAHREDSWLVHYLGQWVDPAGTDRCRSWARSCGADLRALGGGSGDVYLNLVTDEEDTDRVRAFWDERRLARLAAVKSRYDPDNRFRFNHNIEPAGVMAQ
jgi:FAD/FMN-containing dehydrogenase